MVRDSLRACVVGAVVVLMACGGDDAGAGASASGSSSGESGGSSMPDDGSDVGDSSAGTTTGDAADPTSADASTGATSSTSDTTSTGITFGESSSTGETSAVCPDEDIGMRPTVSVDGSNENSGDDSEGSCGGGGANDVVLQWTAPADGRFRIATFGSTYDTLLYVLDGCDGPELGCSDDASAFESAVDLDVVQGQTLAIVVDGYDGASIGAYTLSIFQTACMPDDAGAIVPYATAGTTVDAGDDVYGACGGGGAPDVEIDWTAPVASNYAFSTAGSGFDTVLTVLADDCDGAMLGCNDDAQIDVAGRSEVVLSLDADQAVLVAIDGAIGQSGEWALAITDLGEYAGDCCTDHGGLGCDVPETASCVCEALPQCCTESWDQICVGIDNMFCGGACTPTPGGSCCEVGAAPGCDVPEVAACVCEVFPGCCDDEWIQDCVDVANFVCAVEC